MENLYEIISVDRLRALEMIFPRHLKNLTEMIDRDKVMKQPIIADRETGIVLDGSHRHVFLLMKGFKTAPVKLVDYSSQYIRVGTTRRHNFLVDGPTNISKAEVIRRGLSGDLFPPRTTRHFFPFLKEHINLPLSQLKKGKPIKVDDHIFDVDVRVEIEHNEKYITEIDEEMAEAIRHLHEAVCTKQYLREQIKAMKNGCILSR